MEQLYTIPVNEAFDASMADPACGCPVCALYNKLEENELDLILGASMMEPDVRCKTNEQGFCRVHYRKMFERKNRLGLALMLESHLDKVEKDLHAEGLASLVGGTGADSLKRLDKLEQDCYVCARIEMHLSRMLETILLLYRTDGDFRRRLVAQPWFCLPHYRRLLELGKRTLNKKEFAALYQDMATVERRYIATLKEDVSWFCKKFDYRYQEEPWKNSKDAVERAIYFLRGNDNARAGGKKE